MLGLLALAGVVPSGVGVVTGVGNASGADNKAKDEKRGEECHLTIFCSAPHPKRKAVHGKSIILKDDKVVIASKPSKAEYATKGHPFKGFCIGFPAGEQLRGLVSMSSVDPPAMGWLYADKDTLEMKCGNKTTSTPHIHGPWDLTDDNEGLMLEDEELFVAVEERRGYWTLYYDKPADGTGLPKGKPALPVSIERKSKDVLESG